jgi:hypothetical protein
VVTVPIGLSPAVATASAFNTTAASQVPHRFAVTFGSVVAFVLVATFISALLWRHRE